MTIAARITAGMFVRFRCGERVGMTAQALCCDGLACDVIIVATGEVVRVQTALLVVDSGRRRKWSAAEEAQRQERGA